MATLRSRYPSNFCSRMHPGAWSERSHCTIFPYRKNTKEKKVFPLFLFFFAYCFTFSADHITTIFFTFFVLLLVTSRYTIVRIFAISAREYSKSVSIRATNLVTIFCVWGGSFLNVKYRFMLVCSFETLRQQRLATTHSR